jgi:hypothetical protein
MRTGLTEEDEMQLFFQYRLAKRPVRVQIVP